MKIEEIRTSFTVYVIASDLEPLSGMIDSLGIAGYMVAKFAELTAAFSELYSNPPHFVIFDEQEKRFDLEKAMEQVVSQLPESHVFLVVPMANREKAVGHLERGVYDLIFTPLVSPVELVRTLDRAAERDYFMYLNERLLQSQPSEAPVIEPVQGTTLFDMTTTDMYVAPKTDDFHLNFAHRLFEHTTADGCLKVFVESASHALNSCPAVYFRFIPNRRVLLASFAQNVQTVEVNGLGIDFNEIAPGFRASQLRDPMGVNEFVMMIREIFSVQDFVAWPIEALGELQGVVCFLCPTPQPALANMLNEWIGLLGKALSLIESEKRLHVVSIKDVATDLLNRSTFAAKVGEEISRSRRTRMPVSLLRIAIDNYGPLATNFGPEEVQVVLRMAARVLAKHSRVNDIIGRTGADEFGVVLPHTDKQGAMIKGERLRRMFETSDFSRVLKGFTKLTVSVGISEYPSLAHDADELMQSSDEALFQVRKAGNKVCVGKAIDGFEPDFVIASAPPVAARKAD